jgi:uroporphyrin-III C-methyltransferase/precorrin-2 dehydrogenase/sirohydrochlorin ferrochelatase
MTDHSSEPRRPDEIPQPRLGPLAVLPVFLKLAGRRAVVAGGSEAVAWKAELLAATGARVEVYASAPCAKLISLAQAVESLTLHRREIAPPDFDGAAMGIGDIDDEAGAAAFRTAAKRAGVPVNMIDKPGGSDFQFGAIVERSPLVIGISTDGGAPVFAQSVRTLIETLLPQGFRRWAQAAREWRPDVRALGLDFHARRRFWERFARLAFDHPQRAPQPPDLAALAESARNEAADHAGQGSVVLVGAGPGDPELLTLRAVRALQSADVVLFDDLVLPGALDLARREAVKLAVGKRGYKPSCTQAEISSLLVSLARDGKRVVRL